MAESKANRGLILFSAFVMSFCSLGYQQMLALTLSDASGDFVLSQALTLALFLGGLGLGSGLSGRAPGGWRTLLAVEWALALAGALSVSYLHFAEMTLRFFGMVNQTWFMYLGAAPALIAIGFLSGLELPLLLRLRGPASSSALACNYGGAFLATLIAPVYLLPLFDVTGTVQLFAIVNFLAASLILPMVDPGLNRIAHLMIGAALLAVLNFQGAFHRLHLQWIYFSPRFTTAASLTGDWGWWGRVGEVLRVRTPYQWVDIVPPEFTEDVQGRQDFQLYLDRKIQLSSGSYQRYHEAMVEGGINLLGRAPERVLILGGGDGLLVKELLDHEEIWHIDLVELDPQMIELATTQRELTRINQGALTNPRVKVHIADAFQFVRARKDVYDLVLIDLPFPVSYELSLLFTKEFYTFVKNAIANDGLMLLDFPQPGGPSRHLSVLARTLSAAGFVNPFAFGTEDFFIAAAKNRRELAFDVNRLGPQVANQSLLTFQSRAQDLTEALAQVARVNSVLFPVRMVNGDPGGGAHVRLDNSKGEGIAPLFLHRFYEAWRGIAGLGGGAMPASLREYWLDNMAEPREFVEPAGGHLLPRFQFGIHWDETAVQPVFQWIDSKNPARLREKWSQANCLHDGSDWLGVRWAGDKSWTEFLVLREGRLAARRYENGVFLSERPYAPAEPLKGPVAPEPANPRAADIQFRIQREFLINPRSVSERAFYFP